MEIGKRMKKIIGIILATVFCVLAFCGCEVNSKQVTLEESIEIPENGIITADILKKLKDDNKAVVFKGTSGKNSYEWTVFGSNIKEVKDTNLKIEITEDKEDYLSFKLCSEEEIGFVATLSIHSKYLWTSDSALLFKNEKKLSDALQTVSLTGDKASILSFPISKPGNYIVKAEEAKNSGVKESIASSASGTPAEESKNISGTGNTANSGSQSSHQSSSKEQAATEKKPSEKQKETTEPVTQPTTQEETTQPAEPTTYGCTISIECSTILNNIGNLDESKLGCVPGDGWILYAVYEEFTPGETVFDVLTRVCNNYGIHIEYSWTPLYGSYYIEGIGNLYEFDCGEDSGWMYRVNGWYPNFGCSSYTLANGDYIEWRYTCDLGADVGGGFY